jgi:predicted RNA-binding Zn ribbon-like protein
MADPRNRTRPAAPATPIEKLPIISGSRCLDFVNTVVGFGGTHPRDSLSDTEALRRWAWRIGQPAGHKSGRGEDRALARARRLRQAIGSVAAALAAGGVAPAEALAELGNEAAKAMASRRLVAGRAGLSWRLTGKGLDRLLDELAVEAAELLTGAEAAALRRCQAQDCAWFFVDRSRNHSRLWCDMGDCGNRAKARRRRSRQSHKA